MVGPLAEELVLRLLLVMLFFFIWVIINGQDFLDIQSVLYSFIKLPLHASHGLLRVKVGFIPTDIEKKGTQHASI